MLLRNDDILNSSEAPSERRHIELIRDSFETTNYRIHQRLLRNDDILNSSEAPSKRRNIEFIICAFELDYRFSIFRPNIEFSCSNSAMHCAPMHLSNRVRSGIGVSARQTDCRGARWMCSSTPFLGVCSRRSPEIRFHARSRNFSCRQTPQSATRHGTCLPIRFRL